jgi:hypothetical protein
MKEAKQRQGCADGLSNKAVDKAKVVGKNTADKRKDIMT